MISFTLTSFENWRQRAVTRSGGKCLMSWLFNLFIRFKYVIRICQCVVLKARLLDQVCMYTLHSAAEIKDVIFPLVSLTSQVHKSFLNFERKRPSIICTLTCCNAKHSQGDRRKEKRGEVVWMFRGGFGVKEWWRQFFFLADLCLQKVVPQGKKQ